MDCRTAEGMVNRYISHTLSISELEEFIAHVENCSSCYDELQTYYIVHEAMQQLDEDEEEGSVLDFQELLEEDIRKSQHYILRKKFSRAVAVVGCCVLAACIGGSLLYVFMQLL